ncbi:MAG TPA: ABC transporter permease [Thermoanaerobaculia bacterium]|nr:ABC transporter permease [Thermoanaerobaculia bacterium]
MRALFEDIHYAVRSFHQRRGLPLLMILTLAMGIGANTAVFNIVNALLLRPLPYRTPERLVTLHETQQNKGSSFDPIAPLNLRDWQRETRAFDAVGAFQRSNYNLSLDTRSEWVQGARVEAGLFPLLGIRPLVGRGFTAEEDRPGGDHRVVLLSHTLWQEYFGGDPRAIGRRLRLDGDDYEVIGVMPVHFGFPEWARLWTPLALNPDASGRADRSLNAIARLAPGVTVAQAQSALDEVAGKLATRYPGTNRGSGARVRPLGEELMPKEARLGLLLLLGAAGFVLVIICSNSTSLLIVRVLARFKEFAIRAALGAPRGRLLRQLLAESLLIFLTAGVLAVGASVLAVRLLLAAVPTEFPFWVRFDLDRQVLIFTLGLSLVTGIVFGLFPALRVTGTAAISELRGEGRGMSANKKQGRTWRVLVAGEFALAGVLLICALLLVKSSQRLQEIDRGYRAESVLTGQFLLTGTGYANPAERLAFTERLLAAARALPGVVSAGIVDYLPSSNDYFEAAGAVAEDRPVEHGQEVIAARHAIAGDYLQALQLEWVAGRSFTAAEEASGRPVAIVSADLARTLWPDRSPLGRRLRLAGGNADGEWLTVVGVVGDVHQTPQMGGVGWPVRQIYLPLSRTVARSRTLTLAVRTAGAPATLASALRATVGGLDPHLPLFHLLPLTEVRAELEWLPRFWGKIFSIFALCGALIAAVGLFGIVSHSLAQRGRELGIRAALGARQSDLMLLPLKEGLRLALLGLTFGLTAAFGVAQLLRSLLYGVQPADPWIYGGVAVLIVAIALLASLVPALRALMFNPLRSLRAE